MIKVSKLTKDYGARRAIDNLTFKAERGEIIGFLGPNGAGKTTTMRILSGYMPPTSGKAEIGGFDVVDQSLEVRKIVGYLPETVPLYQDMTVFEFLKYKADLHHVPDAEERVDEVLEMVDLADRARHRTYELSGGEQQRVAIARALVKRPTLILADEPTGQLDSLTGASIIALLKQIAIQAGVTVVVASHDPNVHEAADWLFELRDGQLVGR